VCNKVIDNEPNSEGEIRWFQRGRYRLIGEGLFTTYQNKPHLRGEYESAYQA
jgi:hypothetical protein